ncbi:hypothetical protein [Roseicella aquatilis]|uniref:Uncharacterized protein n=1 Tax=Roseicella aquatilis TaxID=2527868 RepID=A0A4R4DTQ9_9PROT|nr:hypothetical protein [Roseicella aquatilis]TCZ65388.1 hypothetical protein EXY23_04230 [Roseicella aquatilis]
MQQLNVLAPHLAFITLALLAGLVVALNLAGRKPAEVTPLNLGALVFLGQFTSFLALAGIGLPVTVAQGAALTLGAAAAWTEGQ